MRIAHVTDCYLPRLGGIETQVHDLAVRQTAAGHEVDVITATGADAATHGRVPVHRVPVHRVPVHRVPVHRVSRGVAQALAGGYDVLHVHLSMFSPFGLDVAREATLRGVPVAASMHSLWGGWEPVLGATRPLVRWHRRPVAWSAVSTVAARPLRQRLGLDVAVVPNGVDVPWWAQAPQAAPAPQLRVLSVMRLCRRKRPAPLVQMLADVRRLGAASLTIVGGGPAAAGLQRRITAERLPVTLTGPLPRAAIRELMSRHDLYAAPARLESFGIAALEARSAGLPVLGRADTGLLDFVRPGVDGLLVDSDAAMGAALAQLSRDAPLLADLRRRARAVPPPLGWARTLEGYAALYAEASSLAGSRPAALTR